MTREPCIGCLLGTAVGDALGLPYEGLSPRRAKKLFPDAVRHHFLLGKGMVSDDTEHAAFVAQSLIRSHGNAGAFRQHLARSLRWWLLGLPAGIGFATLRAIIKLWLGVSPEASGVASAGNGPAMRSAILGVAAGQDDARLRKLVRASTEITHSDVRAYYAALGVAIAASNAGQIDAPNWQVRYLRALARSMPDDEAREFRELALHAMQSAGRGESVERFAESIGSRNGITGYCYHTVPAVLQVWFRHGNNFERGLPEIIEAGGDTDTAGAIFGGIAGAGLGRTGIPDGWLNAIVEWPRSMQWLERLGAALADDLDPSTPAASIPAYFWPAIVLRNLLFLVVVLAHGLRRLLPPY